MITSGPKYRIGLIALLTIVLFFSAGCLKKNDNEAVRETLPEQPEITEQDINELASGTFSVGGVIKEYYFDNGLQPCPRGYEYYNCTYYASREFHKIAPPPGIIWLANASEWSSKAFENGWVTETDPRKAKIGAVVVYDSHVQIVRDVQEQGIVVQGMNEGWAAHHDPLDPNHQEHWYGGHKFYTGYVYKYYLPFEQIGRGYFFGDFKGYILPVRLNSSVPNNEQILGVQSQEPLTLDEAKRKEIVDFMEKATSHLFIIFPEFYDPNSDIGNDELINLLIFNGITPYSWDESDHIIRFKREDVEWAAKTIFGPYINNITHKSLGLARWEESDQEYQVYPFGSNSYIETYVINILEKSDRYIVDVIHLKYLYDYDRPDETDVYDEDGNNVVVLKGNESISEADLMGLPVRGYILKKTSDGGFYIAGSGKHQ